MSSHGDPMWFCHECNAEMRPLMIPEPHCASCHGSFVEMMDNPEDDPRHQGLPASLFGLANDSSSENDAGDRPAGGMPNILEALSNMFAQPPEHGRDHDHDHERGPARNTSGSAAHEHWGNARGSGGLRIVINTPSGTRSIRLGSTGSSNTPGPGGSREGGDREGNTPLLSEFLASNRQPPNADPSQPQTRRAPAPLLASYLLSNLFGGRGVGQEGHGGAGMFDPFEMLAGGRFGDYVVNEQALQNILNELMANGGAQPTDPPASEEVIENLPRVVLEDGRKSHFHKLSPREAYATLPFLDPLANDTCSICHEPFNPALAASPDAYSSSADAKDDGPSLVGVTLPCEHTFHEDCIIPWMRMKSTCPVCRKSVLPASQNSESSTSPEQTRPSAASPRRHSSGSGEGGSHIPGGWDALD